MNKLEEEFREIDSKIVELEERRKEVQHRMSLLGRGPAKARLMLIPSAARQSRRLQTPLELSAERCWASDDEPQERCQRAGCGVRQELEQAIRVAEAARQNFINKAHSCGLRPIDQPNTETLIRYFALEKATDFEGKAEGAEETDSSDPD